MQFDFKNNDMVQVEVIHAVVLAGADQPVGTRVEVTGWLAKQLLGSAWPLVKLVEAVAPRPFVERDTEVVISTPDPKTESEVVISTPDPKTESEEEKLAQFKKDAEGKRPKQRGHAI